VGALKKEETVLTLAQREKKQPLIEKKGGAPYRREGLRQWGRKKKKGDDVVQEICKGVAFSFF